MRRLKVQKTINNKYNLIQTNLPLKSKTKLPRCEWTSYDNKLNNSISRARSNIFNIVYYNKFYYFFTQTVKDNRDNLNLLITRINETTRRLRKKYKDKQFYYCVIPEYHLDKQNWHLHGFLSKDYDICSQINKNGFLELSCFNYIGFNSIEKIKNYDACLKYCSAYITKDLAKDRKKGERLFYCSHNLIRNNVVSDLVMQQIAPVHFDFKNEFCLKTTLDEKHYYNFVTKLDSSNITFYNYN